MIAVLAAPTTLMGRQNILKNGSMESGEGPGAIDPQVAAEWTEFGVNVERSDAYNLVPPGPGHSLKAFGDMDNTNVGAYQEVTEVSPGQSVFASVQLFSPANDKLRGSGQAGLVLEFLNQFGGLISMQNIYVLDVNSPADTWIPAALGPFAAPDGTAQVRLTCRLRWSFGDILGAAYWDDAQLTIDDGPNQLLNGDFETAGSGAGQSPVGIDDWFGFNDQEKSEDVAKHGIASLKLGTREAYSGLFQNMGVLNDADRIFMIAYAWNPSDDPLTATSRVGIKLEFDANVDVPPPEENLAFDESATPDQWTLVELETTVPDEMSIARIVCIYTGDAQTTGSVHFDSAWAERGSEPGANQLLNASFEYGPGGYNGLDEWTEFSSPGVSQAQKSCFEVPAHDGLCTMRATGQAVAGVYQEIAVTPGDSLYISAYLYTPSFEPLTGTGRAGLKVEWAVGGVPEDVDIGVPGSPNTIGPGAPQDTWLPLTIDYTMPPGTSALARFTNIIEKGTAMTGSVYIDSCEAVVLNVFDGADVDGDGDQDLHDFAWFQRCFSGDGVTAEHWNSIVFDYDDDDDVDFVSTMLLLLAVTAGAAAQTVTVTLGSPQDAQVVPPGATVDWAITFSVSEGDNEGLALLSCDLAQNPDNPAFLDIPPADGVPPEMTNFSRPDGICNPGETDPVTGYIGVQRGAAGMMNLVQIGGAQNTFGEAMPPGSGVGENANVIAGVGQSAPALLAAGTFDAPSACGPYTFELANALANVLVEHNEPPAFSPVTEAIVDTTAGSISFVVTLPGDLDFDGDVDLTDLAPDCWRTTG